MANENLNIVIKAVDKTKQAFGAVTKSLQATKSASKSTHGALSKIEKSSFNALAKSMNSVKRGAVGMQKALVKAAKKSKGALKSLQSGLVGVKNSVFSLKGALISLGAGVVAASFFKTASSLENLQVQLKTVTGSAENADKAFARLTEFTTRTPYEIDQVVSAFTKLKAFGLDPSEEAMVAFGNTASAMGKDLNQMIEAVADAATGEFERLKEFGIKSKQQGDNVSFTFQGVTTTVKKSSEDIQKYLMNIGNVQFAGAMSDQMNTMSGSLSNFRGSWSLFQDALMNAGPFDLAKASLNSLSETLFGAQGSLSSNAKSAGESITQFIKVSVIGLARFVDATRGYVSATWSAISSLWDSFKSMPSEVQSIGIVGLFLGGTKLRLFMVGLLSSIKTIKGFLGMSNIDNAMLTDINAMNKELGHLNLDLMALSEANLSDSPLAEKLSKQAEFLGKAINALESGNALDISLVGDVGGLGDLVIDAARLSAEMGQSEAAMVKFFNKLEEKKNAANSGTTLGDTTIKAANGAVKQITPIDKVSKKLNLGNFDPEAYETETQAVMRAQRERNLELSLMIETGDIGIIRAAELRAAAEVTAQSELTNIVKKGESDRQTLMMLSTNTKNSMAMEAGKETLGILAKHNKAAFGINKAAAIKEALISTYAGVAAAVKLPFPLNIAQGALALATGMAQVQSIRSTQFREKGGPVSSGSPYIVGERGRELFVPQQAGTIVPSDQLGGGGNYTINISANDTEGFDELLTKRRGTLMNLINQALNENGRPALA